jgi:hypothetical protein
MIDPYDPFHPDGPDDSDDLPGGPMTTISWLDDEDSFGDDWSLDPQLEVQERASAWLSGASLPCGACGQPAASWVYAVSIGDDGMTVIDGQAVCEAHRAAA